MFLKLTHITKRAIFNIFSDDKIAQNLIQVIEQNTGTSGDLGYYADAPALIAAHPVANAGDFAIVGSTDSIWIWNPNTLAWVNTVASAATLHTNLSVFLYGPAGLIYNVTASGVNYIKSDDNGYLGNSAADFRTQERISIYLNGQYLEKQVDAIWISPIEFQLMEVVDPGDVLIVIS